MGVALPPYPQDPPPAWCARYVGQLPYERGARGPDAFDCWGTVMLVLQHEAKLPIPAYEGVVWNVKERASHEPCARVISEQAVALWEPVEPGQEREFDVVVLNLAARPLHVGVVAGPGWMLHSDEDAGCALERYDGMHWRNRVDSFQRFRGAA